MQSLACIEFEKKAVFKTLYQEKIIKKTNIRKKIIKKKPIS